jgi:hypothetical protein
MTRVLRTKRVPMAGGRLFRRAGSVIRPIRDGYGAHHLVSCIDKYEKRFPFACLSLG